MRRFFHRLFGEDCADVYERRRSHHHSPAESRELGSQMALGAAAVAGEKSGPFFRAPPRTPDEFYPMSDTHRAIVHSAATHAMRDTSVHLGGIYAPDYSHVSHAVHRGAQTTADAAMHSWTRNHLHADHITHATLYESARIGAQAALAEAERQAERARREHAAKFWPYF